MKILCVHNYYGSASPSGENIAYDCDVALLRGFGHTVVEFTSSSDELRARPVLGRMKGALSFIWNPFAQRQLRRVVRSQRPDIMHVHNVFPRFSPGILAAAGGTTTATVYTLHNYRLFCSAGTAVRDGRACKTCADRRGVLPAIQYRCYRSSLLATAPVAASLALHQAANTMRKYVDAFVTLTEFQRELFIGADLLPAERVHVRPNFMPGSHTSVPLPQRTPRVVFVGRISPEKGVDVLIKAWQHCGDNAPKLVLVGDGPSRVLLERLAADEVRAGRIEFVGQLPPHETLGIIRDSRLLVLPSLCFEGFPMVIREAFALGVPVLASNVGALPQLVAGRGGAFAAGDSVALAARLRELWRDEVGLERLSRSALEAYESEYSEHAAHEALLRIYEAARSRRLGITYRTPSSVGEHQ